MDIYSELILDHYQNPRNFGSIKNPSKKSIVFNPSCGDRIEIDVVLDKNKIKKIKFRADGCVISSASASMLTEQVKGITKDNLKKLDKNFMIKLIGIKLGPTRIRCALLPLEGLHKLL